MGDARKYPEIRAARFQYAMLWLWCCGCRRRSVLINMGCASSGSTTMSPSPTSTPSYLSCTSKRT
eukprot:scaffold10376_cov131-Isochrysis_galbana.AAC.3